MADTVDTACLPGRSPTQRHLLSQGGDPGSRSPGVLPTLRGVDHPGRPLGIGDYLPRILRRTDPTPKVPRVLEHTSPPPQGLLVLSNGVEDCLWKGTLVLTPLDQVRSGYYSIYFLVPKKDGGHTTILNLKFFNLNVCKIETVLHHSHHVTTPVVGQRGSHGHVLPCMSGAPTPPVPQIPLAGHQLPNSVYYHLACHRSPESLQTLAPLIARLRLLKVQLYAYLDDLLIVGDSKVEAANPLRRLFRSSSTSDS